MVRIARHLEVVLDGRLSTDTLSFLNATVAWSAGGGSMETDVEAALLPFSLQLSFREPDTGPELQTEFGGGENGLNLFLDTHIAAIEADPTFVPSTEAILYVDGLLRDTWAETIPDGNLDLNALADTYEAMATRDITLFASPLTGLGIDVTGVTVTGPSAQCQDAGTIWSQQAQSYTHYVDFTQTATAVMPPGNSENPLSGWFENQQDDWVTGTLLPAPLAPEIPTSGTPVIVLTP
jgi:hypothetical protein